MFNYGVLLLLLGIEKSKEATDGRQDVGLQLRPCKRWKQYSASHSQYHHYCVLSQALESNWITLPIVVDALTPSDSIGRPRLRLWLCSMVNSPTLAKDEGSR